MNEEALFHDVLALPLSQREAFLADKCAGNPVLFQAVQELLQAHSKENPLDQTAENPNKLVGALPNFVAHHLTHHANQPDELLAGRYRLEEKMGEGGMGEVWVARQTDPVKRKVAIKLIKKGMDSASVIHRFEQERQALALMDHANIARIYDAGVTERGSPFFVMELIHGMPLQKYCDEGKLSIQERLALFIQICQAVQHAHQKGIVHRDLKPRNILVMVEDGRAIPKIIDFGVAKALSGKLTDDTFITQMGAVLGTMEYMAPEQAGQSVIDVDTRADIYSLGVILFELLTGLRPFDSERLKKAAFDEVLRILKSEEPPSLASRLSTDESLPNLAAVRQTEPRMLLTLLKGELDWITQKCLEKDRNRRYESAGGLARDIERYLQDVPVEAKPISTGYRLRKFIQRHKLQVMAVLGLLGILMLATFATSLGLVYAIKQKDKAEIAMQAETAALREAEKRQKEAEKNLNYSRKANEILGSIFTSLEPKSIAQSGKPLQVVLKQNLHQAIKELEGNSIGDPLFVAEIQATLAQSLYGLGDYATSAALLEKAFTTRESILGRNHPATLSCCDHWAVSLQGSGQIKQAIRLLEENLRLRKIVSGETHEDTILAMANLSEAYREIHQLDMALPLCIESMKLREEVLGKNHEATRLSKHNLALIYIEQGRDNLAIPLLEEILNWSQVYFKENEPSLLSNKNNLAVSYMRAGKYELAIARMLEVLEAQKKLLGPDHPNTLGTLNNLGVTYSTLGNYAKALVYLEEAHQKEKKTLGAEHPATLNSMRNLASTYSSLGKFDKAIPMLEECWQVTTAKLGREHQDTITNMIFLGQAYSDANQMQKALPLLTEGIRLAEVKLGADHPQTFSARNYLGTLYWKQRQPEKAIPIFEDLLQKKRAMKGKEHPDTLRTGANLGVNYKDAGRFQEALPHLEAAHKQATSNPPLQFATMALIELYIKLNKKEAALECIEPEIKRVQATLPPDSGQLGNSLALLGSHLVTLGYHDKAEPILREAIRIREKTQPGGWTTFNTYSLLGEVLVKQQKPEEGIALLIQGYDGLKEREKNIPTIAGPRVTEALQRIIGYYRDAGNLEELRKWEAKLK